MIETKHEHRSHADGLHRKLAILADAAKYDASCASSGAGGRNSRDGKGLGSTTGSGICHAYTPDGRCVSLLKVLLTNFCVYDCAYCVNRVSSDTPRARFKVEEIVSLTLGFYRRNMIEGLFLSSGIVKSEDHTMEEMVRVAETLRHDHEFRGYIHLKAIAGASQDLIERAGRAADRLSVNVELPTDETLARLAPQKDAARHPHRDGRPSFAPRRSEGGEAEDAARSPLRPGRAKHPDDHRRGRGAGPGHHRAVRLALCLLSAAGASTTPPSAPFRTPRRSFRCAGRR